MSPCYMAEPGIWGYKSDEQDHHGPALMELAVWRKFRHIKGTCSSQCGQCEFG